MNLRIKKERKLVSVSDALQTAGTSGTESARQQPTSINMLRPIGEWKCDLPRANKQRNYFVRLRARAAYMK